MYTTGSLTDKLIKKVSQILTHDCPIVLIRWYTSQSLDVYFLLLVAIFKNSGCLENYRLQYHAANFEKFNLFWLQLLSFC